MTNQTRSDVLGVSRGELRECDWCVDVVKRFDAATRAHNPVADRNTIRNVRADDTQIRVHHLACKSSFQFADGLIALSKSVRRIRHLAMFGVPVPVALEKTH